MCGIAGWIDWDADLTQERRVLEKMAERISSRGPDSFGIWLSPRAGLVHRRLIVIDPEGGSQPMVRHYGEHTYVINYNGELYNTSELREQLLARGHKFYGHSDTEVLLASFVEWGPSCVDRLNGIFAFTVWDEYNLSLFMARDRLGVKPLFYTQRGGAFIYGSELKALLAHPAVEPRVGAEGLAEIFVMGPSRTPGHGIYEGIAELKPGYCLIHDRKGSRARQYWFLESRPHPDDENTTASRIRELLEDTVVRQLVSDVPVCVMLSGGIDSSAVTAFSTAAYQKAGLGPVHSFSVDFADNDKFFKPSNYQTNPDGPWVKRVAGFYGTIHHNVILDTPELVEYLTKALFARDLPGMADVDTSLLLFCREIKKNATVAVSGEAADEVFGGYPWFHMKESLAQDGFPWIRKLAERMELFSPDLVAMIKPEEYLNNRYRQAQAEVPRLAGEDPLEARMRELLYLNITRFLPTLLDRKDRMSMAVGLEVRVPYCDHRLVQYVFNIPWSMKMSGQLPKGILRRALAGVLPEDVLTRRKHPYPSTHNPAYLEACRNLFLQIMEDSSSPLVRLLNIPAARKLALGRTSFQDQPWFSQLMGIAQLYSYLVQTHFWLKEYHVQIG